ncbi:inorganic phosphate transport PHO88 [Nadsonia fulvescens var. elongata DSM 6958]|uniref:Inorganic phosphate transport PHO88 n=1 Tax=Nadsonia fulvescens var. elongata DSM 6958 TaxID=857566 RepID=A0A1E3PE25_9ASCO|nr:inorganic phosphate transport PHO88 [Nadsonia fulvescens var. elongata DSM 6958]
MVNAAISNLVIMLVMMQVSKKIPFEDPTVLLLVRGAYILSNVLIFGLYFYTKSLIMKKNDLTTMKYVEPSSPLSGSDESKLITTTIRDYDLQQVKTATKGVFTGIAMMGFMHLYMQYTNPLLMQSIMPLKSAFEQPIVQIHLFGKPSSGDLKRPFKAPSLFNAGGAGADAKTDKKAVAEAEKAGSGGAKEE